MTNVVICDDDRVTRGAITVLCEELGLDVVAETDRWIDALELIRRFDVDILVLDLSLVDGSGEQVLAGLRDVGSAPLVVIFSSYSQDFRRLTQLGAAEVVEKPDFDRLARTLERLAAGRHADAEPAPISRRTASRSTETLPALWRSPSGIGSHKELGVALVHVIECDSVLVVAVRGVDELESTIGPLLVADCHLAVGRILADLVRAQDSVHEHPQVAGFVALLRGGNEVAPLATWRRLVAIVEGSSLPGQLVGTHGLVDPRGSRDAVARAVGELLSGGGMTSRPYSA